MFWGGWRVFSRQPSQWHLALRLDPNPPPHLHEAALICASNLVGADLRRPIELFGKLLVIRGHKLVYSMLSLQPCSGFSAGQPLACSSTG